MPRCKLLLLLAAAFFFQGLQHHVAEALFPGSPVPCDNPPTTDITVTWTPCASGTSAAGTVCSGTCAEGLVDNGTVPQATCYYDNGEAYWVLNDGGCQDTVATCQPLTGTPANGDSSWDATCTDTTVGAVCDVSCAQGSSGTGYQATCTSEGWALDGSCEADSPLSCSTPPSSSLILNAAWSCPVTQSGVTCTGSCPSGSGVPVALCNNGAWVYSSGSCTAAPCPAAPPSSLAANTLWANSSCASGAPSNSTCKGTCATGFQPHPTAGAPVAGCDSGSWRLLNLGACVAAPPPKLACNGSTLPTADGSLAWLSSCTAAAVADGTLCTASCSEGYKASGAGSPSTKCSNGTWTPLTGEACVPKGCELEQPGPGVAVNATWNCKLPAAHLSNCTATGCAGSSGGVTNAPVATCAFGQWSYAGGTCTGGGRSFLFNIEAPNAFINYITQSIANGRMLNIVNTEFADFPAVLQQQYPYLWNLPYTDLQLASIYNVPGPSFKRRLLDSGREQITVGVQVKSASRGVLPVAIEASLDFLTSRKPLFEQATTWGMTVIAKANVLPPSFDFSQVTVGKYDATGTIIPDTVTTPANCYLAFQGNSPALRALSMSTGYGLMQQPEALAAEDAGNSSTPELCPGSATLIANFPYKSSNAQELKFTAAAINTAMSSMADPNVGCSVTGGTGQSSNIQASCATKNGQPLDAGALYKVVLTGSYKCANSNVSTFAFADYKIRDAVQLTVLQQDLFRPQICSSANKATMNFNYTLIGEAGAAEAAVSAAATATAPGVKCTATLRKGSTVTVHNRPVTTGTVKVACQGQMKPGSTMLVNLQVTATPGSCGPVTATATGQVSVTCCKQGRTYPRVGSGSNKSKCFQHFVPGTVAKRCTNETLPLFGLYNRGPASAVLAFFDGKTKRCASQGFVGSVVTSCDSTNNSVVKFAVQSSNTNPKVAQRFMLSCEVPAKPGECPGGVKWYNGLDQQFAPTVRVQGSSKTVTFTALLPANSTCTCNDAYWTVTESATFSGLPIKLCAT